MELIVAALVFIDGEGQIREQLIYPAIAQPDVLQALAEAVNVEAGGLLSFKLGSQTYQSVVDYVVTQGPEPLTGTLQVEPVPATNSDGIADVVLVYPNGERQVLFVIE